MLKACASDCSNNGYCSTGLTCVSGFRGEDCVCKSDDCQHGTCDVDSDYAYVFDGVVTIVASSFVLVITHVPRGGFARNIIEREVIAAILI